jgi:trimethylamine--corrinoid protein Co-methyltransferase
MIELAVAVMGSEEELKKRPIFNLVVGTLSPLVIDELTTDTFSLFGKYGIPIELVPMPIAGGTGPVTIAGLTLLAHTELLAGIIVAQIANPGAPMVYRPGPNMMDMSSGAALEAPVENAMVAAAGAQLMRETYGIPTNMIAQVTDTFITDGQSMIERVFSTLLPALVGANVVSGAGGLEHVYTGDPVQLVIDDEIMGMTKRVLRGFEINDDTLGLEALARVGPGGNFLSDDHTLKYFKTEYYKPRIFNRGTREIWQSKGAKDLNENARERAKTILREHKPAPLPDDVLKELDSIIKRIG